MTTKELLFLVTKAKNSAIMGEDLIDDLTEIEQALITDLKESGEVGKMSKSGKVCFRINNESFEIDADTASEEIKKMITDKLEITYGVGSEIVTFIKTSKEKCK